MGHDLTKEFQYYLDNQDEIVREYNGKFVVIKNCALIGAYDNELDALQKTKEEHQAGTFLVQRVSPGDTEYSQTFHSRVTFS